MINKPSITGITSRQMIIAPKDAIFIWLDENTYYPIRLARHLNRQDLTIVGPTWLSPDRYSGRNYSHIVLDHACKLTLVQYQNLLYIKSKLKAQENTHGNYKVRTRED